MQQLAIRGIYQNGMVLLPQPIRYKSKTEVVLVFPLRPDTTLHFDRVVNEATELRFKHSIEAKLLADGDILFLGYPELGITGYGQDLRETTQNFQEVFIATFEHYTRQPDTVLTDKAQQLKAKLTDLVTQYVNLLETEL